MSALAFVPLVACSTCDGRGTVDIPGCPVCSVCSRCSGVGTVRGVVERGRGWYALTLAERVERLDDLRRRAILASAGVCS